MDQERLKALLAESITVLCKSGIQYNTNFTIQGLLGITVDDKDVFLVDIHEKIEERLSLELADKRSGRRSPGVKRRGKDQQVKRCKRKRSESDSSQTPSPEHAGLDLSHTEGSVHTDQSYIVDTEGSVHTDQSYTVDTDGDSGRKESSRWTVVNTQSCSLEMAVDQILDHANDTAAWRGDDEEYSKRTKNRTNTVQNANTSAVYRSGSVSGNVKVKVEEDDIVFVKQETRDASSRHASQTRTITSAETFPGGPFQDFVGDSQAESGGLFQHAQPYPPGVDQSFTSGTEGLSANQTDLFQVIEQDRASANTSSLTVQDCIRGTITRPKAGTNVAREYVQKYGMVDIGNGVYIHRDEERRALQREDGKAMARQLLSILFTKQEIKQGTLTKSKDSKFIQLDPRKVEAITERSKLVHAETTVQQKEGQIHGKDLQIPQNELNTVQLSSLELPRTSLSLPISHMSWRAGYRHQSKKQVRNTQPTRGPFVCSYCSKSFSYSHVLKRHILLHTGERPFSCNICQRAFNQQSSLKRHMLTHTQL